MPSRSQNKHIDVRVEGIEKILRRFNKRNPIYAGPWVSALKESAALAQGDMIRHAPGDLGAKITTRLHARPVPLWAKVGLLPMPSNRGFRYPGALHGAISRFHYRSGPFQSQNTHGWLTAPLVTLQAVINQILGKAANRIEAEWESEQ